MKSKNLTITLKPGNIKSSRNPVYCKVSGVVKKVKLSKDFKNAGTITSIWEDDKNKKFKLWNKIDKLIGRRDVFMLRKDWDSAAKLYIKLSILIYRNLK